MKLSEFLLPLMRDRFHMHSLQEPAEGPFALFPQIHTDVGSLELHDDGDEITLIVGDFAHCHFSSTEPELAPERRAVEIADKLLPFLAKIFSEEIEFWGSHTGAGGTRARGTQGALSKLVSGSRTYTWSGPTRLRGG